MARGKLSVRYIKEILRLRYEVGLSQRDISHSVRVSVGSVNQYLARAAKAGLGWPLPDDMDQKGLVSDVNYLCRSASIIFAGFSFPFFHSFVVVGDSFHLLI